MLKIIMEAVMETLCENWVISIAIVLCFSALVFLNYWENPSSHFILRTFLPVLIALPIIIFVAWLNERLK
jgi:hypothetical protein